MLQNRSVLVVIEMSSRDSSTRDALFERRSSSNSNHSRGFTTAQEQLHDNALPTVAEDLANSQRSGASGESDSRERQSQSSQTSNGKRKSNQFHTGFHPHSRKKGETLEQCERATERAAVSEAAASPSTGRRGALRNVSNSNSDQSKTSAPSNLT